MRACYGLLWLALAVAPAWAGCCGHGPSDSSLAALLTTLLALFLLVGPTLGAVIGEIALLAKGHRFHFSRVLRSIGVGVLVSVVIGFLLMAGGAIVLVTPAFGALASLYTCLQKGRAPLAWDDAPEIGISKDV